MHKLGAVIFIASLYVLLPASLLAQKGEMLGLGENRLHNGDFENNVAAPWQLEVMASRGAAGEMELTKKTAASGDRSVKVTVTKVVVQAGGTNVKLKQNDRCFEKNEKFTVAFWSKAEEKRDFQLAFQQGRDPFTFYQGKAFSVDTEWKEDSMTWTPNQDNFQDHRLMFMVGDSDVPVWFDDVRYFLGEPKDEVGHEPIEQAVLPEAKLTTTWAQLRSEY